MVGAAVVVTGSDLNLEQSKKKSLVNSQNSGINKFKTYKSP